MTEAPSAFFKGLSREASRLANRSWLHSPLVARRGVISHPRKEMKFVDGVEAGKNCWLAGPRTHTDKNCRKFRPFFGDGDFGTGF